MQGIYFLDKPLQVTKGLDNVRRRLSQAHPEKMSFGGVKCLQKYI